jgi:hypothetical protein
MAQGLNYKEKIQIGEHCYVRPPLPKDRQEILFVDNCKEDAFWQRRIDYPEVFKSFCPFITKVDCSHTKWDDNTGELIQVSVEDTKIIRSLYHDINRKRRNGVFFRNGDDIEYLTGSNWFTLEHCKMFGNSKNGGYGLFYKYQRDIFYLLELMWKIEWCLGLDISKAKKTGVTQIIDGGYCVDMGTSRFEWMIGFMSRNMDVAIENNMKLFLYAFDNLMMPIRPKVGFKAPKGGNIEFSELTKKNVLKSGTDEVLNTKVFCVPTSEHSFDSHFMNIERMDEFPKYWQDSKKSPKEILRNNKAGAKDQDFNRGRIIISSYPPEEDDIGSEEGGEVFRESKLSTMKFGKTESELICYHIPAFKSLKSCIDKYGDCDEKKAMEIISNNRERVKKDRKALLAEIRQNPNSEEEAFGSNTMGSVFDPHRLTEISLALEEEQILSPNNPYVEGKLEWVNKKWESLMKNKRPKGEFGKVEFIPLTKEEMMKGEKGRLRIYQEMSENLRNSVLRNGKDEFDCLIPNQFYTHVGGADPTSHAAASEVIQGSKYAFIVKSRRDNRIDAMYKKPATGIITHVYFERPELPDEAYEDLVKLIIYTGALFTVEANMPEHATRLIAEGLGRFMLVKDLAGNFVIWSRWMGLAHEEDKQYKLIRTTSNSQDSKIMLEIFVRLIKMFLQRPEPGEKDYGMTLKDERIIKQLMKVDPTDTKLFDLFMALGYCEFTDDVYTGLLLEGTEDVYSGLNLSSVLLAFER